MVDQFAVLADSLIHQGRLIMLILRLSLIMLLISPTITWAHGVVGQRFFPESITVEDPFPADEMDLLAPAYIKSPEGKERSFGFGIQKRLSPNLGLSIEAEHVSVTPLDPADPKTSGFANPEITLKYAVMRNPAHETIVTTTLGVVPPYGGRDVRENQKTVLTTGLLFGKGLGDLPDSFGFLKPLAIAGAVSLETLLGTTPVDSTSLEAEPTGTLHYGLIVEYSIPYLQSFVKDVGIPKPFSRMIPIVEFSFSTPVNGPSERHPESAAFANPGILWAGKYVELGVEAQIPLSDSTGHNVGVIGLIHLFLDDIAPGVFSWTPFHGTLGPTQR